MLPIIIDGRETIPKLMINTLQWFNIKNHKIFLTMSLSLDWNILECLISLFLFFDTKWIHDICCLKLIYCVIYDHSALSRSSISQEASLFSFFQNCWDLFIKYSSRCVFFRLRFGAIKNFAEKNFLITGTNNNRIEQDLGSTEDAIECESIKL